MLAFGGATIGLAAFGVRDGRAQQPRFAPTPRQAEGPFYPPTVPLDSDADLVRVKGSGREAGGDVMYLLGHLRQRDGRFLARTQIEIWQCDVNGRYLHPRSDGFGPRDEAFQGFGRTMTDSSGAFQFRTIKPVPYPGRTPHIHVKLYPTDAAPLTTQLYVRDDPGNRRDRLFNSLTPEDQDLLSMTVAPGTINGERALLTAVTLVIS